MDTVHHLARMRRLPKTHLHVHLEGGARPDTIREFATRAGVTPPDLWSFRDLAGLVGRSGSSRR
jgi:adenosine deaminase